MVEKAAKQSKESIKKERLAQALRENLKRRKAQTRERAHDEADE